MEYNQISQPAQDNTEVVSAEQNYQAFIKLLLSLLIFITVFQFSSFGMQSVEYILSLVFGVLVVSTPLDAMIGFLAMIASVYVFTGSVMQWMGKISAVKYLTLGGLFFVFKNVLDLINVTVLYNMENPITTAAQISDLAGQLGMQFFQLAFWLFVVGFFKVVVDKKHLIFK